MTAIESPSAAHCPADDERRFAAFADPGPALERRGDRWIVRSEDLVRQVLREDDALRQAGFAAPAARKGLKRLPLIYAHGDPHRRQRSLVARYFAPAVVDSRYRELMAREVDAFIATVQRERSVTIDELSLRYSVAVAREVVGLTDSGIDGLSRRLEQFFRADQLLDSHPLVQRLHGLLGIVRTGLFYWYDVRPAIAVRRREERQDVVSHLLAEGAGPLDIAVEAITYAAAGMVTTREFVTLATWQLLTRPDWRARYLVADTKERYAVLHEILRLDPVVGTLLREVIEPFALEVDGEQVPVPVGTLLALDVRDATVDPAVVGACPVTAHPGRSLPRGVKADVVAFGEGPHRCPGAFIAIQETDMLLTELLRLPLIIETEPELGVEALTESYTLRGLRVRLTDDPAVTSVPGRVSRPA